MNGKKAIGLVEFKSIAMGLVAADNMIKTANVDVIEATVLCPGKYILLISGDVGSIQSAVDRGVNDFAENVIDSFVLANVHDDVFPALNGATPIDDLESLGIIETFSVASAIVAADASAKAAAVELLEVRIARGMGGKSFVLMTGDVGAVTAAVEAGAASVKEDGFLVSTAVIPNPAPKLWEMTV
ncbi:MAG: hypothetical protein PWQ93_1385 [Clostridiales bacterium]|nr:hypothetical protein [Clostridiales bacterium]